MDRKVSKVHLPFHVVQCPIGLKSVSFVPRIGPYGCITFTDTYSGAILHGTNKSSTTSHGKTGIPFLWQQKFEIYLITNNTSYLTMGDRLLNLFGLDNGDIR